jgi:hypothetical protein
MAAVLLLLEKSGFRLEDAGETSLSKGDFGNCLSQICLDQRAISPD